MSNFSEGGIMNKDVIRWLEAYIFKDDDDNWCPACESIINIDINEWDRLRESVGLERWKLDPNKWPPD